MCQILASSRYSSSGWNTTWGYRCSYGWICVIQRGRGLILFIISQLKLLKLNPCLKLQSKYRIKLISPGNLGLWEHYRSPWFERHVPPAHGDIWRMLFCANCPPPPPNLALPFLFGSDPTNSRFPRDFPVTGTSTTCGCAQTPLL